MYTIDILFLVFAFITLYLTFLFLVIFLENRRDLFREVKGESLLSVSVIVPAYNEADNIRSTLDSVLGLSYPRKLLEVIVVDDGSTDNTAEIAREFDVKVIVKENGGKASALNVGIEHALGEIIACIDADASPDADSLRLMVPYFLDKDVAAVTSSIFVKNPRNILERLQEIEYVLIAWGRKLLDYLDSVYVTPGPLSLYRGDVIRGVGGFHKGVLTEDIEIAWRLQKEGYKIRMALPARVYTTVPDSFRIWWSQRLRWDIGGIQTIRMYKSAFLSKKYGVFGFFIVPFFSTSIFISLLGLGLFLYLLMVRALDFLVFSYHAYLAGIDPLKYYPIVLVPNVFTILGILIFAFSIIYVIIGLRSMNRNVLTPAAIFEILLYLSIYLFLFPILLVQSFWRLLVYREQKW